MVLGKYFKSSAKYDGVIFFIHVDQLVGNKGARKEKKKKRLQIDKSTIKGASQSAALKLWKVVMVAAVVPADSCST